MPKFGSHVSIAGSIDQSVDRAKERNCDTFQIFTRNPRGWASKELIDSEISSFIQKVQDYNMSPTVVHMPYLPNLSSPDDLIYEKSVSTFFDDFKRCDVLQIDYLVIHLGSHMGSGKESGLKKLVGAFNTILNSSSKTVNLLLEITAGQKNSMGSSFEDLDLILKELNSDQVGVCFDTCHAFAAGYDLRTYDDVDDVVKKFDEIIGLNKLKLLHLNDSRGDLNSGSDRHDHIGLGKIGDGGFRSITTHEYLKNIPGILETPVDDRRDDLGNLSKIRSLSE